MPGVAAYLERWAPITVVRGIQGYGKTTAVTTWLDVQPEDVVSVWVSARGSQDDPAALGRHLAREMDRAGLGGSAAAKERGHREDSIAALDHASFTHPDERLVLVIDDAHVLSDDRLLQSLVDVVTRQQNLRLVLCSRGPHRVEQLAAGKVEVVAVPARALLLSVQQIAELARRMDAPLTLEQARQLHRAFGGWAAAVQLVLGGVDAPVDQLPLAMAEDYLRDTVLPHIGDQRMLREIARFSLAERLTHRLIRNLAEAHEPDALVRLVEAPGLAERRYQGVDVGLAFPTFIQSCLRDHFTSQEPDAARAMHRRLGAWFAANDGPDHPLYALQHAVAGEDWEQADQIWTHRSAALALHWPDQLEGLLRDLPEPVLASRPGMRVAKETIQAAAQDRSDVERRTLTLSAYIEASRRIAERDLDSLPVHDLLYVGTGHVVALRAEGRLAEADKAADRIEATATSLTASGQKGGDRLPIFHLQRGLIHTLIGAHPAAVHRYHLAWRTRRLTAPQVGATAAANLALTHALVGDPSASRHWLDQHANLDIRPGAADELVDAGAHHIASGLLALDRLDADRCGAALELLSHTPTADLELGPVVDYLIAQYHLHFGSPAAGLGTLHAAVSAHPDRAGSAIAATLLLRARADLLLAAGQGLQARSLLAGHTAPLDPVLAVASARISLLAGDPIAASRLTSSLAWRDTTENRTRLDLLLLHALAAHRMGDLETSADTTRQALALYRSTRILRSFASLAPDDLAALLGNAEEALPPQDLAILAQPPIPFPRRIEVITLTRRELLISNALASNASRQEIADQLYVSVNTIRSQLATLYRKLDVTTRDQALARLMKLGLIQLHPESSAP